MARKTGIGRKAGGMRKPKAAKKIDSIRDAPPKKREFGEIVHVVKRKGHMEPFDERKVYASVYWASKSANFSEQEAEVIATAVVDALKAHLRDKRMIDSKEIFEFVWREMDKTNPDAAYMYRTHLDIS